MGKSTINGHHSYLYRNGCMISSGAVAASGLIWWYLPSQPPTTRRWVFGCSWRNDSDEQGLVNVPWLGDFMGFWTSLESKYLLEMMNPSIFLGWCEKMLDYQALTIRIGWDWRIKQDWWGSLGLVWIGLAPPSRKYGTYWCWKKKLHGPPGWWLAARQAVNWSCHTFYFYPLWGNCI